MIPNVLSIAGFDPSGCAGIAADLKTFAALGCHGMAVVTALTAQNTHEVRSVHVPLASFAAEQIDAVLDDIHVAAVKIGMLASAAVVEAVAERLAFHKPGIIILDPVLSATSGESLSAEGTAEAILRNLLPLVTLITPNAAEAARLSGQEIASDGSGMRRAASVLQASGARAVLIKGGHLQGKTSDDFLFDPGGCKVFSAPRIATRNTRGTGCTLSSAIAAYLAKGEALSEAIGAAKSYLTGALAAAHALSVGHGPGPVNHFYDLWSL
ncbi:MAG TPA: bifunctional hydroxymethylpyrimidine kinase/phosphomethylpyrimidine kinase [Methylocella sp.]|nr:bifunctional hydroxymethylpyrimidine kinase/phosphomethylpyrimidine kinase [Methylocella sp.]